jgi:hypothetical protein
LDFKERKEIGNIGEDIVYTALQEQIIPNRGNIKMFTVIDGDEDSIAYNLKNGDIGFLGINHAECRVDVKCGDEITERCLNNLDEGAYLFLNAKPNNKTSGLPFMFKLDASVKNWIRTNIHPQFKFADGKEVKWFRILKRDLVLPDGYVYEFEQKKFEKHRTDYLVKIGELLP